MKATNNIHYKDLRREASYNPHLWAMLEAMKQARRQRARKINEAITAIFFGLLFIGCIIGWGYSLSL